MSSAVREVEEYENSLQKLFGRVPSTRLRALLTPPLSLDFAGLDFARLGASERLRLIVAALPAVLHRPQLGRSALEKALKEAPHAAAEDRSAAESQLAYLALATGDVTAAEAYARRATVLGRSERAQATARVILSRVLARMNRLDQAWEESEFGREIGIRTGDSALTAAALRSQGTIMLFRLRLPEAEKMFREAISLATLTEERDLVATIRYNLAFALLYSGRVDAAALEIEAALSNAPLSAEALLRMGLGRMLEAQGRKVEAAEAYGAATDRLREGGDPFYLAQAVTYLGELALGWNDLPAARRAFTEAVEIRRTIGDRLGLMTAYKGLGSVAHREGRLRSAERHLREALRFSLEIGEPMAGANTRIALARVLTDAGQKAEALLEARRARRGIAALHADSKALTPDDTLSLEVADELVGELSVKR